MPEGFSGKLGKPIALFNGRDLDGWIWYQRPPKPGKFLWLIYAAVANFRECIFTFLALGSSGSSICAAFSSEK